MEHKPLGLIAFVLVGWYHLHTPVFAAAQSSGSAIQAQSQSTWTKEPDGFAGITFNTTEANASVHLAALRCVNTSVIGDRACYGELMAEGIPFQAVLTFRSNRMITVTGGCEIRLFPQVKRIFIERYGPSHTVKNFNAEGEILQWQGKKAGIWLLQRTGGHTLFYVFLIAEQAETEKAARQQQK